MFRSRHIACVVLASLAVLMPACSDDNHPTFQNGDAGDAAPGGSGSGATSGSGGTPSGSGGTPSGSGGTSGTGGTSATGGTTSSSGGSLATGGATSGSGGTTSSSGGMSGTGGTSATGGTASLPDGGGVDAGPDGGDERGLLLATGTDFFATTEVVAFDLATRSVTAHTSFADGDAVVRANGGRGFVLERTSSALDMLSPTGDVERRVAFNGGDGGATLLNPHDAVVVPGANGPKIYIPFYDSNAIGVVDAASGTLTSVIDLSEFYDSRDTDGSADVDRGFYDPATGRAYFMVGRIDVNTITSATNFDLVCPPVQGLIVAIDSATDSIAKASRRVDGGDAGIENAWAAPLHFVSPTDIAFDAARGRALVVSSGCLSRGVDGGAGSFGQNGIEAVDLRTGASTPLYSPGSPNFLNGLILFGDGTALVQSFDAFFDTLWNVWDPSSPALGQSLSHVPDGVAANGNGALAGAIVASFTDGGVGGTAVDYRVATDAQSVLASASWTSSASLSIGSVALVR